MSLSTLERPRQTKSAVHWRCCEQLRWTNNSLTDVFLQETNQQTDCEIIKIIVVFVHNFAEIKKFPQRYC